MSKNPSDINIRAADMWSYAVLLWELATREVPFGDLSPMEAGMRVRMATHTNKMLIFNKIADSHRGFEIDNLSWNFHPYGKAHKDLYE